MLFSLFLLYKLVERPFDLFYISETPEKDKLFRYLGDSVWKHISCGRLQFYWAAFLL